MFDVDSGVAAGQTYTLHLHTVGVQQKSPPVCVQAHTHAHIRVCACMHIFIFFYFLDNAPVHIGL